MTRNTEFSLWPALNSHFSYKKIVFFNIISSNIRFDNPRDGIHQWGRRKQILCRVINDFTPHILATQEGRQKQLNDLSSLLDNLTLIDSHRSWIAQRMYPSIFCNLQSLTIRQSGDIWLSTTPSIPGSSSFQSAFPRLCTWIEGKFIDSHNEFFFVNVHLDHILAQTRLKQIEVLIKEVKKVNTRNLPLILCGDFNESPEGEVREMINQELPTLYDPWPLFNEQEMSSHHSFTGLTHNGERIDWILVDKTMHCHSLYLDTTSLNTIYPSDHFPVKGVFSF